MARAKPDTDKYLPSPEQRSLVTLARAITSCQGCTLHVDATQAVFGTGADDARLVIIGEQPGDREDRTGKPFVGQAGRLLEKSLVEAGIDPAATYLTNAVKHFKFVRRGKRRIHDKPTHYQMQACLPWLVAELETLVPDVIVLLGATAAKSLYGSKFKVTEERGKRLESQWATAAVATIHPAAIIRNPDEAAKEAARRGFVDDLRVAAALLAEAAAPR